MLGMTATANRPPPVMYGGGGVGGGGGAFPPQQSQFLTATQAPPYLNFPPAVSVRVGAPIRADDPPQFDAALFRDTVSISGSSVSFTDGSVEFLPPPPRAHPSPPAVRPFHSDAVFDGVAPAANGRQRRCFYAPTPPLPPPPPPPLVMPGYQDARSALVESGRLMLPAAERKKLRRAANRRAQRARRRDAKVVAAEEYRMKASDEANMLMVNTFGLPPSRDDDDDDDDFGIALEPDFGGDVVPGDDAGSAAGEVDDEGSLDASIVDLPSDWDAADGLFSRC